MRCRLLTLVMILPGWRSQFPQTRKRTVGSVARGFDLGSSILLLVLVFSLVPNSHLSGCDQHGDVEGHADGTFYMQNLELCRELQADVTSGVIDAEIVMSAR